ncbi:hypothetical protein CC86DRAFT_136207 [Ophiobolus disseminans]|uniref:Uncharacterized protein n=1 Tax=Ophiobolus disseminans TaxID=1469910 RepID=A0A6A7ACZ9_9PLEO|nr:hypothetical protein CC86DRAFT_136207 [Ophiobolus disseminans]
MDGANIIFFPAKQEADLKYRVHSACVTKMLITLMWSYDVQKKESERKILANLEDMFEHGI